jgi:Holliday junction DNA helicase RuvA
MLAYIIGKVVKINDHYLIFENNYLGYIINISNQSRFQMNKIIKIYTVKKITNTNKNFINEEIYGFSDLLEKKIFLSLLKISGIGPKTALNICSNDCKILVSLIKQKDQEGLSTLPAITSKIANQIINEISDEYHDNDETNDIYIYTDLIKALKSLGYAQDEIEYGIKCLNNNEMKSELSDMIAIVIKKIAQKNNHEFST